MVAVRLAVTTQAASLCPAPGTHAGLGTTIYILWTCLSTLLLLSLLVAILSYDFQASWRATAGWARAAVRNDKSPERRVACLVTAQVGVEAAEREWLVVLASYLVKQQRLIGDDVVQRMKAEDLARCHTMGGFNTPVAGARGPGLKRTFGWPRAGLQPCLGSTPERVVLGSRTARRGQDQPARGAQGHPSAAVHHLGEHGALAARARLHA